MISRQVDEALLGLNQIRENEGLENLFLDYEGLRKQMPCVAEVMSPPRVVPEAVALGCKGGGSYDLDTGWNFLDYRQQHSCVAEMERLGVDCVVVTPPCDQFSAL